MARVVLAEGKQRDFLQAVYTKCNSDWVNIAFLAGVCRRTLYDWRREKYQMSLEAAQKLSACLQVPMPETMGVLPEHWSAKKAARAGGLVRNARHGNPGTLESRIKGGLRSQELRRLFPEKYPRVVHRKSMLIPEPSPLLAEFVGIMLGDGGISSNHQINISFNFTTDKEYALFVANLLESLFAITASTTPVRKNTLSLIATSTSLVEFLTKIGLVRGNKIKQQADIPSWVFEDNDFAIACLRGLMDTDGGIYYHNHTTKGITYRHIGICFTSYSIPLLGSVQKILAELGFNAKNDGKAHVSIYRRAEVQRYFEVVGSNNPKHWRRFESYFRQEMLK